MNALSLYISTCRYVVQANPHDPETWSDLSSYLPYLRQALGCYVCGKILCDPIGPPDGVCQHHVCKECRGGKMRLKPSCSWCKDHEQFVENQRLYTVLQCFKKLCEFIASSAIATTLTNTNSGETNNLLGIIHEGMSLQDTYAAASCKPPLLPPKLHRMNSAGAAGFVLPMEHGQLDLLTSFKTVSDSSGACEDISEVEMPMPTTPSMLSDGPAELSTEQDVAHPRSPVEVKKEDKSVVNAGSPPLTANLKVTSNTVESVPILEKPLVNDNFDVTSNEENDLIDVQNLNDSQTGVLRINDSLSEAVAAEHDYNKGLPTSDETVSPPSGRRHKSHSDHGNMIKKIKLDAAMNDRKAASMVSETVKTKSSKASKNKGRGCRCGLATPNPGKLTCCGQRCPCYSAFKGCYDCRCRGCRNPRGDITRSLIIPALLPLQVQAVSSIKQEESDADIIIDV